MSYNIVLTTAEDIVAVVDAVIAKGSEAAKDFIAEFTGIATDDQVLKALQMACELQLIVFDSSRGCYGSPSFWPGSLYLHHQTSRRLCLCA